MRSYFTSLFLLLFSVQLHAAGKGCTEVTISAHPNYPPFHWRNGDAMTGASVAVTQEILTSMGVKSRAVYVGPWKRVLKNAKSGDVDLIPALKNVAERRDYLAFTTNPFYYNPVAVFVRANDMRVIKALADLDGLVGSINLGDRHGEEIDHYIDNSDTIQQVLGLDSNFTILDLGRTDFFIEGFYTGRQFLNSHPLKTKIRVAKKFEANWVHHGFSKSSDCVHLLERFDQKLKGLLESGYIEQKMREYEQRWMEQQSKTQSNQSAL